MKKSNKSVRCSGELDIMLLMLKIKYRKWPVLLPNKVYIQTYDSGVDFLGWVHFNYHRQIRTTTRRKIAKNLERYPTKETINSYRGLLNHGNTYKFRKRFDSIFNSN